MGNTAEKRSAKQADEAQANEHQANNSKVLTNLNKKSKLKREQQTSNNIAMPQTEIIQKQNPKKLPKLVVATTTTTTKKPSIVRVVNQETPTTQSTTKAAANSKEPQPPTSPQTTPTLEPTNNDETSSSSVVERRPSARKISFSNSPLLYGRELAEYDNIQVDDLLGELTPEELELLSAEIDPDDSRVPPSQRCKDQTKRRPTGPLDKKSLNKYLQQYAITSS